MPQQKCDKEQQFWNIMFSRATGEIRHRGEIVGGCTLRIFKFFTGYTSQMSKFTIHFRTASNM